MKRLVPMALALVLAACSQGSDDKGDAGGAPAGGPPPAPKPVTLSMRANATGGEALYVEYCAMCHTPNGMGHGLLARRLDQPDLELREDLTADYVVQAARMGIGNMPPIPRGEVSDADLQAIAEYLAAGPHEVGQ
jgi:mono/diheme cytochrome c family protein